VTLNTPEVITAMSLGAACYLATLGTAWKALTAMQARLRLVAPPKEHAQPETGSAAKAPGKTLKEVA
jgi:hypothetical protein